MKILVINCGSSSLKYQLYNMDNNEVLAKGLVERIGIDGSNLQHKPAGKAKDKYVFEQPLKNHSEAIKLVMDKLVDPECGVIADLSEINGVGHRVLHGSKFFTESCVVTEEVKKVVTECADLGPLHNPANLMGIEACEELMPGVKNVAVFDTAFHQTMPPKAYMYPLPYEYYEKYNVRRYGFHGTSHRYVSKRAIEMLGNPEHSRVITCHLGNGSSIAAVKDGKCIDTSMGLTPLAGFEMGTRCGDIDPAIVPYLMKKENLTPDEIDNIIATKLVLFWVNLNTKAFKIFTNSSSVTTVVFADTSCEYDSITTTKSYNIRTDVLSNLVSEHINTKLSSFVTFVHSSFSISVVA